MANYLPLILIFRFPRVFQIAYFVVSLWFAIMGRKRRGGFWCFLFASVLLSPVVGFMMLIVAGEKKE